MNTLKKQIENMTDASGFEWTEEMMEEVYMKVLYQIAESLNDYDVSFIEKLDGEENGQEKIYKYVQEKKVDLVEIIKKEIDTVKALKPY